ncbi:hypothetical protein WMY93_033891, partial [Mugilogobius chulae]
MNRTERGKRSGGDGEREKQKIYLQEKTYTRHRRTPRWVQSLEQKHSHLKKLCAFNGEREKKRSRKRKRKPQAKDQSVVQVKVKRRENFN